MSNIFRKSAFAGLALLLFPTVSLGSEAYLDDRSDPSTLIASYYNALNRSEYARAWSYWHEHADAGRYAAFFEEVVGRRWIDFAVGDAVAEGAAGSTYYTVPLAITRVDAQGNGTTLMGCVVLRLVQPSIQEPPFAPLHIENMELVTTDLQPPAALKRACE